LNETPIMLAGNLCADPELSFTPQGNQVANLRLAVTPRVRSGEGAWEDGPTSFYRVTCWGQLAANATETLAKGARVVVTGRLRIRQYETEDGRKGQAAEVTADDLGLSLLFATAQLHRATSNDNGADGPASRRAAAKPDAPF
jgi:single-strand DNA-binding protein